MWQQCYSMVSRRRHWKQKYQLGNPHNTYTEKKGGLNLGNGYGNRYGRCCFTVVFRPFLEVCFKSITRLWTPLNNLYFFYIYLILHHGTNVADFLLSYFSCPVWSLNSHYELGSCLFHERSLYRTELICPCKFWYSSPISETTKDKTSISPLTRDLFSV